ncbi:MAG: NAD-dependent epimerase/dehydratase family protein [Candidatus Adiutrix sp.]|jgi:nucleoside-diphosphate-sugar epimerase|nr:NAD-dependent epimerase/dehydratase family protein [Candidatus Adiutrix sp.]
MKVLLSGAQGFLGGRILDFLLERGWTVRTVTRRPAPEIAARGVETLLADLRDGPAVRAAARGVDGVIHCAAKSGVWGPLDDYLQANLVGSFNVLEAARRGGAAWLVGASSPSVVHSGRPLDGVDESAPYAARPERPYAYSKMLAERMILAADQPGGFRTAALRPHLIWGPGDPHFLPRLKAKAAAGRLWLLKSTALVDGTYIDTAAEAFLAAAGLFRAGRGDVIGGRAYFVAQGEPLTAPDLISRILQAVSPPGQSLKASGLLPAWLGRAGGSVLERAWYLLRLKGEPPLTGFVAEELSLPHWFRLDRLKRDLDFKAPVSLAEGLERLRQHSRRESRL